jgi:hypothetical protein
VGVREADESEEHEQQENRLAADESDPGRKAGGLEPTGDQPLLEEAGTGPCEKA